MELGRFWQTLEYFDVIPLCSWWRRLRGIELPKTVGVEPVGVILLVARAQDVRSPVLDKLINQGYRVRWMYLRSDIEAVNAMLNSYPHIETIGFDNSASLNADILADVRSIVYVSNSELDAIGTDLVYLSDRYLPKSAERVIFDFAKPNLEISNIWGAIDDVVMGGVSDSNIRLVEGAALFSGNVSTANSGGFASVRTKNLEPPLDLSSYQGIELKVKGDGQRYKLFIRTNPGWDSLAYSYSFDTAYHSWLNVQIPFVEMVPVFRAKTVPSADRINLKEVRAFQIMLSKFEYDGQLNPQFHPGNFALEIASIRAYGGNDSPQFILVGNSDRSLVAEALQRTNLNNKFAECSDLDRLII